MRAAVLTAVETPLQMTGEIPRKAAALDESGKLQPWLDSYEYSRPTRRSEAPRLQGKSS